MKQPTQIKANSGYYLLSIAVLCVLAYFMMKALTPFGSATSPDSIGYLDMAYNHQQGLGLSSTVFSIETAGSPTVVAQRIWPPAYPWLLSNFINSPFDVYTSARISLALLFCTGVLLLLLINRVTSRPVLALLTAAGVMITTPMVLISTYAWSENLFIPLLLGVVYAALGYLDNKEEKIGARLAWLVSLVVLSIFLVLTRYIGVMIIVIFPLLLLFSRKDRVNCTSIVLGGIVFCAVIGLFLGQNYQLTGSFSGGARMPATVSLLENVQFMACAFSAIFPTSPVGWVVALLLTGGGFYGFIALDKSQDASNTEVNENKPNNYQHLIVVLVVPLAYLGTLLLMRSYSQFDNIDIRLIAPAVPLLIIGAMMLPSLFSAHRKVSLIMLFLTSMLLISLAARGGDLINSATIHWHEDGTPNLPMSKRGYFNNMTPGKALSPASEFFRQQMAPSSFLLIDRPLLWRFQAQVNTLQKPQVFDVLTMHKLNSLPDGSIMVLSIPEAEHFASIANEQGWQVEQTKLTNATVIHLPILKHGSK